MRGEPLTGAPGDGLRPISPKPLTADSEAVLQQTALPSIATIKINPSAKKTGGGGHVEHQRRIE